LVFAIFCAVVSKFPMDVPAGLDELDEKKPNEPNIISKTIPISINVLTMVFNTGVFAIDAIKSAILPIIFPPELIINFPIFNAYSANVLKANLFVVLL